jgi:hypothetical protein
MTSDRRNSVSEDEARDLWRRATEIQQAAERDRSRESAPAPPQPGELPLDQVVKVAEEVGIDRDHVLLALAERRLPDAAELNRSRPRSLWARVLLEEPDGIEASSLVQAPPEAVVAALAKIADRDTFALDLEDRIGDEPAEHIVLVYRKRSSSLLGTPGFHGSMQASDARAVLATIHPEGGGTRLRLRFPLYERRMNLALSGGAGGLFGTGGTAGGLAIGEALVALVGAPPALAVAPAAAGALAGGALGVWAFRRLQRWGYGEGRTALERLARAVTVEAESSALGR